jgi:hypothetical protein
VARARQPAAAHAPTPCPLPAPSPLHCAQIAEFIKKHAKQFGKQLAVREVPGAYPRLVLSGGGERSTIRIDNWKRDTILEFLRDKLKEQQQPAAA